MKRLIIIFVLLILSGCITPYQKLAGLGGYTDRQLDSNTYRVEFKGNGYTPLETLDIYLLYRCAELTIEKGYDYFVIVTRDNISETSINSNSGMTITFGSRGKDSHKSDKHTLVTKYSATAMIKLFMGKKPENDTAAFDAREIMNNLQSEIVMPKDYGPLSVLQGEYL